MYFLMLLVLELMPPLADGYPGLIMPLAFVIGVSMLKDMYEDVKRHRSDNEENNRRCQVGHPVRKGEDIQK